MTNHNASKSIFRSKANKHAKKKSNVSNQWLKDNNETLVEIRKMIQTVQNSPSIFSEGANDYVDNQECIIEKICQNDQIPNSKCEDLKRNDVITKTHDHTLVVDQVLQQKSIDKQQSHAPSIVNEIHFLKNNQNKINVGHKLKKVYMKDFSSQINSIQNEVCYNNEEASTMLKNLELNTNEILDSKILCVKEKGDKALSKIQKIKTRICKAMDLLKSCHDEVSFFLFSLIQTLQHNLKKISYNRTFWSFSTSYNMICFYYFQIHFY